MHVFPIYYGTDRIFVCHIHSSQGGNFMHNYTALSTLLGIQATFKLCNLFERVKYISEKDKCASWKIWMLGIEILGNTKFGMIESDRYCIKCSISELWNRN